MPPTRIVVAGGTGLLGRALVDAFVASGHDVIVLTRQASSAALDPAAPFAPHAGVRLAHWTPDGTVGPWRAFLDGAAAVVNLAGESLAAGRWSGSQKLRLRESRFDATRSLVAAMAGSDTPPVFVSASAVGYYGNRGDERLTEASPPGSDFVADLCVEWEALARHAASSARRVIVVRSGLVLDREGGALPRMVAPVRFFVGGPLGSGTQYISWIHIDDWVKLIEWAIAEPRIEGPINATTPNPAPNREFVRAIARVLGRPAFFPVPAFALRVLLGEMADGLLLCSQRVIPERALAAGFQFGYPDLLPALEAVLRRPR